MVRKRLIIAGLIGLCILALLVILPVFNSVRINAPMIGIPLFITRNGQDVLPDQIHSVRYRINTASPKPAQEMRSADLREANHIADNIYHFGAPFSIYHENFGRTWVNPEYRSLFLRIEFADGKIVSLSYPIISDTRENLPMYVDVSDEQR